MQLHCLFTAAACACGLSLLVACGEAPVPALAAPAQDVPAAWMGKWNGPEGTYLALSRKPDATYDVAIRNLDGERTFAGTGAAGAVRFTRDGREETIKATDGAATGMKWLADKKNCLTVHAGEGYCRD